MTGILNWRLHSSCIVEPMCDPLPSKGFIKVDIPGQGYGDFYILRCEIIAVKNYVMLCQQNKAHLVAQAQVLVGTQDFKRTFNQRKTAWAAKLTSTGNDDVWYSK